MFEKFRTRFGLDSPPQQTVDVAPAARVTGLPELLGTFGGVSVGNGLYRIIRSDQLTAWHDRVVDAFPGAADRITCFGYDWLGRAFAVDSGRSVEGEPGVVMLEPGTGQSLEIPANLISFHEEELIDYTEAALAEEFYRQWMTSGGTPPKYDQCVGYKVPLFLGGEDSVANLETSDLDVYWHLMTQLIVSTRGLPAGARVRIT